VEMETCREFGSALDPSTSPDFHSQFHEHATRQASRPAPTSGPPERLPEPKRGPGPALGDPTIPSLGLGGPVLSTADTAESAAHDIHPEPSKFCSALPSSLPPPPATQPKALVLGESKALYSCTCGKPNPAPTPLPPPPLLLREGRHPGGRPATLRQKPRATEPLFPHPVAFAFGAGPNPVGRSVAEAKRGR